MGNPEQSLTYGDLKMTWGRPGRHVSPGNDYVPLSGEIVHGNIPVYFERRTAGHPDRLAVKAQGRSSSYDEVNRWANRLAHAILQREGTGGEPVAFYLGHGIRPIIAILAILKSGNIYVPIDPGSALDRTAFLLQDSGARLILTSHRLRPDIQDIAGEKIAIIDLDALNSELPDTNPELPLEPDTPASIIYTSGSTGQPKGVLSTHLNLLHSVLVSTDTRHVCEKDRFALLFSYSTGMSRSEIFGALLNGAALFPYDISHHHHDSEGLNNLAAWLVREKISILAMVPTVFRYFVGSLTGGETFADLRLLSIGGETVHPSDIQLFKDHFPQSCLLRLGMGMTETCSAITSIFFDRDVEISGNITPVGYPMKDITILLLDENMEEVGLNRPGEIVIQSRYLSPGYWHNPELTEQRFGAVSEEDGLRCCRSGDLGLKTEDGCLFHLGRIDHQIKVRGHRVETEEIERTLLSVENVSLAAVRAFPDEYGQNRIAAYLEWDRGDQPTITEMRALMRKKLPDHMIPSDFIYLDTMPLTTSGKIDRPALAAPDSSRPRLDTRFVAPRTPTEEHLAVIWSEILSVSPVGVHDDFFDLGGHSLSAVRLIAQIDRKFGKHLPASVLFKASTIENLASVLVEDQEAEPWSTIVPISRNGDKPPLFLVHTLTGDVVSYADLARHLVPDRPCYGIRAAGLDGKHRPVRDLERMASIYIDEMLTVQPGGPYLLGGMCFGGAVAFEMACQLQSAGETIDMLVLIDTPCPPFPFTQHLLFQFKRLWWHIKEDWSGISRRASNRSSTPDRQTIASRLLALHTTSLILRVDRANHHALKRYRPRSFTGDILHFLRSQDVPVHFKDMRTKWEKHVRGSIEEHTIPGDHQTLLREPNVREIAKIINEHLP